MRQWTGIVLFLFLAVVEGVCGQSPGISLWATDPLVKVFPDTSPATSSQRVEMQGGANEYLSAQVAVRSNRDLKKVSARWQALRHKDGGYTIPAESLRWRFVGFIPVNKNTPNTAAGNLLRAAPCEIPDPLLEASEIELPAGRTQPIWLTVFVPRDAPPGMYEGQFAVGNDGTSQTIAVSLQVFPFVLPNERHLWVTNWFDPARIARFHKVEPWSEQHWSLLERYGANMAAHRQNVVLTPLSLIRVMQEADGRLAFDYAQFDRWVRLFEKVGACERIEIGHMARFGTGKWDSKEIVLNTITATDAGGKKVALPPEKGLAPLLTDLERHLNERGWLDKAVIHVADEPSLHNLESWRKASEFVHRAAPGLRRIDAIETRDFGGYLEIWVPKLNYLPGWLDDFRAAQRAGNEIWFYTCLHPQGYFPNRLLDYPLIGTRILHWLNWRYRLDGYLHWGWNSWPDDPFKAPDDRLPPGDRFIVYPGKEGPLDSIRWEMMREGVQDYEEFRFLAEKTKQVIERLGDAAVGIDPRQRSDEICRRVITSFSDYEKDPAAFRAARRLLLDEIAAIEAPPLALVACAPPAETELVPGPIVVEVYGAVEKGANVKVAGSPVEVASDGRFVVRTAPSSKTSAIEIVVEHNGRTKVLNRHYRVRPLQQ
jgi:hypothetical protein